MAARTGAGRGPERPPALQSLSMADGAAETAWIGRGRAGLLRRSRGGRRGSHGALPAAAQDCGVEAVALERGRRDTSGARRWLPRRRGVPTSTGEPRSTRTRRRGGDAAANRSHHLRRERHDAVLDGLAAARNVRMARETPPFTNRTALVSPSWLVLAAADGDEHPVAVRPVPVVLVVGEQFHRASVSSPEPVIGGAAREPRPGRWSSAK